jgi:hypothetical protein
VPVVESEPRREPPSLFFFAFLPFLWKSTRRLLCKNDMAAVVGTTSKVQPGHGGRVMVSVEVAQQGVKGVVCKDENLLLNKRK